GRYFEACLNPMGYSRQFDFLGNSIACLLKLGTLEQRTSILETGQSIVHNLPLKLCPAFWPPIFETDPEWPSLHLSFKDKFRNEPFRYHNGGSWPMVTGWWGSALLTEGYRDDAIAVLNTLHVANSLGQDENVWEFNECFTSITGAPDGVTPCAWSAAAPLMLNAQLSGRSSLTFGNP
ncbi:MAG: hypothetical protein KDD62_14000, partial [Bdellovibrionales bacterium]|nr:hypothetical protein [Bdellovibrionales bacterium]